MGSAGALGEPLRIEEWYHIHPEAETVLSVRLGVYPGEIVVVTEKAHQWLQGEPVDHDDADGDFYLIRYKDFAESITALGFVRL